MASAREKGAKRAKSTRAARSDRYAYVSLVMDRETNTISMESPFLSVAEAEGILANAFACLQRGANARMDNLNFETDFEEEDDG